MPAREKRGKQRFMVELEGGGGAIEIGGGKSPSGKGTPGLKSGRGTPAVKSGRGSLRGDDEREKERPGLRGEVETLAPAWRDGGSSRASSESGYWKSEYFGEKVGSAHF